MENCGSEAVKIPPIFSQKFFQDLLFFRFGKSLFSYNATKVLLDFHGFWVPRGVQKKIKKRFRKINIEQKQPKTDCSQKKKKKIY